MGQPLWDQTGVTHYRGLAMKRFNDYLSRQKAKQAGKAGWILLWLIGVPVPVLLVLFLLRGCT